MNPETLVETKRPTAPPAKPDASTLAGIFRPRSIAVIGASTKRGSIGREIVHNLISGDFKGKLFPVNPKADYIHSIKAYPSITDVPDPVDLAVVVVPALAVLDVARECGERGVKGLVVISAGFREIGGDGAAREKELLAICRQYDMRMVGPNCLGVFNADPSVSLNATFAPGMPAAGPVGFVSQSGALGIAIWTEMQKRNVGFSQFASIGNKADVTGNDLIEYWENDPNTELMGLYIESFGDPRRFTHLARRVTKRKPILMVKSGRTEAGAKAASSHTGALSGLDRATDALIRQTGVIRARTIDDMMSLMSAFARCPLPRGRRVAVLTNAGGPAIMATDALIGYGMQLADMDEPTREKLAERLPAEASVSNPIDMIASADTGNFRACLKILLESESVDLVIVAFVPPIMVDPMDVVAAVTETKKGSEKPVLMVLMAEEQYYGRIPREIPDAPPIYRYPESAAYAAAEMANHAAWRAHDGGSIPEVNADREAARRIVAEAGRPGQYLDSDAAYRILQAYGFPLAEWRCVRTADEAAAAADELGFPVALKVAGRNIVHKSDVGGVALNLRNTLELEGAFGRMSRAVKQLGHDPEAEGFLVQRMSDAGREVILGMSTDPVIGPVLMFGMGGKYVEVLKDVTLRVHPITDVDAREMVEGIRGYPLLEGVRGEAPVALPVVHDALIRLSALVTDFPEFWEIDLNPFLLSPDPARCRIVDARIRIAG
ncbi:MAG: acetate--CoA ligase family protein [Gemmatimonadetes bacterium]|nr:acetate--CoA ligase family protein [Gemmatimonadota bacterium]